MAKGQMRSPKEQRKKKGDGKKDKTPRYLRAAESGGIVRATQGDQKK